ncbi:hypothetical protein BDV96DRAFT_598478 [Lophiotrema nucula]|uniref:Secreted protein n=1 Tax=Lophiotrema nucula TaxID=690887 RepID=A0A6A5ZAU9_9PLEO|nr:hypothetical protein BDV96DRAFT_598478 [Lophiotrema nucula]
MNCPLRRVVYLHCLLCAVGLLAVTSCSPQSRWTTCSGFEHFSAAPITQDSRRHGCVRSAISTAGARSKMSGRGVRIARHSAMPKRAHFLCQTTLDAGPHLLPQ